MNMDAVEAFVVELIQAEHAARESALRDSDEEFEPKLDAVRALIASSDAHPIDLVINRVPGLTPEGRAAQAERVVRPAARALFQLVEHYSPTLGPLWCTYVGTKLDLEVAQYDLRWWVAEVDGALTVIAIDEVGLGLELDSEPTFQLWQGRSVDDAGPPLAIRSLATSDLPPEAAHQAALAEALEPR